MRVMMRMAGVAVAMAVLTIPVAAQGRGQGPMEGRGTMMGGPGLMARNPAATVLEHRAALELTAEQIDRLKGIRDRVETENAPRLEQMRAAFGDANPRDLSVEERQALRAKMQDLAPLRNEIRTTNRAAGQEIHALLTDVQKETLRPLMRADRPGRGAKGDRPARDRRSPRGPRGGGATGG